MKKICGPGAAALGLVLGATLAGPGMNAAWAQDWTPEFVYGKLQPLPDGFPAGPITLVAVGDPGALLAQRLSEYSRLFTPVDIKVEKHPEFANAWEALKYAAAAEGGAEGYVNVMFTSPDDIITLHTTADLGVGLDDLSEVVGIEDHRYAVIQCKDAAWEPTWEGLVQQIKDNPGAVRYAGGEPGDRLDVTFAHYMQSQGLGSLYDTGVIAFSNTGDVAARTDAVIACEADVTVTDMGQVITEQKGEKADVVLVSGHKRLGKYKEVPTASEAGIADDPMSRTMQVVVPAAVDPLRVKWLNALWGKTGKDSYFKAQRVLDQPVNLSNLLDDEASAALNDATSAKIEAVVDTLGIGQ